MSVAAVQPVTIDALVEMPDGDRFELVHGELVERSLNPYAAVIAGKIFRRLDEYCDRDLTAVAIPDGAGFLLDEDTLRKPDAALVLRSRLVDGRLPHPCFPYPPDLAIEVISPSDQVGRVEEKVEEYFAAGTKAVWVVRPLARVIELRLPGRDPTIFGRDDDLTADPILPEFRLRVSDVFPLPAPIMPKFPQDD